MKIKISRSTPMSGATELPGDKSISHRAALFSAFAHGKSFFTNFQESGVTHVMLQALKELGLKITQFNDVLIVAGQGLSDLQSPSHVINCGHSGTTMRLLTGAINAANISATLDGSPALRQRPMDRIVSPLTKMGAIIQSNKGKAPLQIIQRPEGTSLKGIIYHSPISSAQVKSAVLISGITACSPTTVIEPGPSRDHTERMLGAMGASIKREKCKEGYCVTVLPNGSSFLHPIRFEIPGDFSSAAFLISAAAIIPDSKIHLKKVGLNWTRTGLLDALGGMGGAVQIRIAEETSFEEIGDIKITQAPLDNIEIRGELVVRMIDEFPAFAVMAAFAKGITNVKDAQELRTKESDRIKGICAGLAKCGVRIEEKPDGFIIDGSPKDLPGGVVLHPGKDHRLAMAYVLLGLRAKTPIIIEGAEIINQSYPGFISALERLGVTSIEVIHE